MHSAAGTSSSTGAMKDAYQDRQAQLKEYTDCVKPIKNQIGLMVFIDNRPAGLDLFARAQSYAKASGLLTQSYAMDAITSTLATSSTAETETVGVTITQDRASRFIHGLSDLKEQPFESVGIGRDFRYHGNDQNGTALLAEGAPVHASFFSKIDD